ncbi:MAG: hypothetical protein WD885_00895, partial [Candidatus Saccharimonadales bacterium]
FLVVKSKQRWYPLIRKMSKNNYDKYEKEEIKRLGQLIKEFRNESRKTTLFLVLTMVSLLVAFYSIFILK